jgi:hypothetical protein
LRKGEKIIFNVSKGIFPSIKCWFIQLTWYLDTLFAWVHYDLYHITEHKMWRE